MSQAEKEILGAERFPAAWKSLLIGLAFLLMATISWPEENPFPILRDPAKKQPIPPLHKKESVLPSGLLHRLYHVPPSYGGKAVRDRDNLPTAKDVLEKAGIDFSAEGSGASFDPATAILSVTLPRAEMDLVNAYVDSILPGQEKRIAVRLEIYSVPALTAIEITDSCRGRSVHNAERNFLFSLAKRDSSVLEFFSHAVARSGSRTRISMGHWLLEDTGPILEFDPVLGADNETIDLNLSFTYPSAPRKDGVSHDKEVSSQLTAIDGNYYLLSSWRPSGKLEHVEKDLMHLVFFKATIQVDQRPSRK